MHSILPKPGDGGRIKPFQRAVWPIDDMMEAYSKLTLEPEADDSVPLTGIWLPIEPHGLAPFLTLDDDEVLTADVVAVWPQLWPKMREELDEQMKGYDVKVALGEDTFFGSLDRMEPDVYMGDKSDVMIRLEFDEPPLWDFFIKGSDIVHAQAVF